MRTTYALLLPVLVILAGCPEEPPPPPTRVDSGPPRDSGITPFDAGPPRDAGPAGPTVDGEIREDEWRNGVLAENEIVTNRAGSVLTNLRAVIFDDRLVVGVEGTLAAGDTLVLFVDREIDGADGVANLADLSDPVGALDIAVSTDLTAPVGFRPDFALGTTVVPRTVVGLDATAGWRDVTMDNVELVWIAGEEGTLVCTDMACEAALPLDMLGGVAPRTIGVFARILASDGTWTNQTLPQDDDVNPATVSQYLALEDGVTLEPDAGVPDAGMDATTSGFVIDGVIDPVEWAAVGVFSNTVSASGTSFEGNALLTLRAVRSGGQLYVGIECALIGSNAILMFVDADVGGIEGLTMNTGTLNDLSGELDRALSTKLIFLPAELRVDYAWGTLDLSRVASATDTRMGWRDIATNPVILTAPPVGAALSACSATACETSIDLTTLGARAAGNVGVSVRLGSDQFDLLSNQTLPEDVAPEFVSTFVEVSP